MANNAVSSLKALPDRDMKLTQLKQIRRKLVRDNRHGSADSNVLRDKKLTVHCAMNQVIVGDGACGKTSLVRIYMIQVLPNTESG